MTLNALRCSRPYLWLHRQFLEVAERLREVGDECLGSGCECPCHLRLIDGSISSGGPET